MKRLPRVFGNLPAHPPRAHVIARGKHGISRRDISDNALKVLKRLHEAGFEGYLVGGCVRDLLIGIKPKDFDVTTNAHPEQVVKLFKNARLIGRRFKLVHVQFGREIIEVATFRAHHTHVEPDDHHTKTHHSSHSSSGRILRDNVYGSIEEDAMRRDFTINALYYTLDSFAVHDYAHGMDDINARVIRLIGNAEQRYREDPVRMLRAIRFAAKLNFTIEKSTLTPIASLGHLLHDIPPSRLFDEILKLFLSGYAERTFELLQKHQLLMHVLPATAQIMNSNDPIAAAFLQKALINTDKRIADGKPVTPAFLFAAFLWYPQVRLQQQLEMEGMPTFPARHEAAQTIITNQCNHTAIPRRFSVPMREIWDFQARLPQRHGKRADATLANPRFRAAYDFLLLRVEAGEPFAELAQWWTVYQVADEAERRAMIKKIADGNPSLKKKRRSPRKPKPQPDAAV
jgi:poly(A) polymerase